MLKSEGETIGVLVIPDRAEMKADIRTRWISALRSGEYQQGTGALRTDGGFCCLGVLCDIAAKDGFGRWAGDEDDGAFIVNDTRESGTLPKEVRQWAGLPESFSDVGFLQQKREIVDHELFRGDEDFEAGGHIFDLADKNDSLESFSYIADLIEENTVGV